MDWHAHVRRHLALPPGPETDSLVEELAQHLYDVFDEALRSGHSHAEATTIAEAALDVEGRRGSTELIRRPRSTARALAAWSRLEEPDLLPDKGSWPTMFNFIWRDVSYGCRVLARTPGVTIVAVLTLALGIGATTAAFTLVNATLLAHLAVEDVDRLVYVGNGPSAEAVFSYPGYVDLRDHNDVFDGLIAWGGITVSLSVERQTDTVTGAIVSGNFFDVLGTSAALGRTLGPGDDVTPGGHPVVVISHGLWQRRLGGRRDVIGSTLTLNGRPFSIVGVTAADFTGAQVGVRRDLYVPLMMQAIMRPPRAGFSGEMNPDLLRVRTNQWLFAIGRLRPGVTRERAQSTLVALQLGLDPPERPRPQNLAERITLAPVSAGPPEARAPLVSAATLLAIVVGTVLLIACANVTNLLLLRATARRREISVRLAVGAGRGHIVRQLLTESVLLALAGGLLGTLLSYGLVQLFLAWPPPAGALPMLLEPSLDRRVLLFALCLSLGTGVTFGLVPALHTARTGLVPLLQDDTLVPASGSRRLTLRNGLVVAQVTLSLALLVVAGLFLRSLREAQQIDSGYAVDRLIRLDLPLNLLRYTRTQGGDFYRRAIERVEAIPGVTSAAVARVPVLTGAARSSSLHLEGRSGADSAFTSEGTAGTGTRDETLANVVSANYFETLGLRLTAGRDFGAEDADGAPSTLIVNQAFVRRHLADGEAIGRRVSVNGQNGPWRVIVGIVSDGKYRSLSEAASPIVYLPLSQNHETGMTLHVRTVVDPSSLVGWIRREVQRLEPHLPLGDVQPMTQTIGSSLYLARAGALLISGLGALALILASIGLYGVLAFAVSRRTREIGIRTALGARSTSVFSLVVVEGMALVGIGIFLGVLLARSASSVIGEFLVGVQPTDTPTYVGVACLLAIVAAVACAVPAWRATKVDPLVALRLP